MEYKLIRVYRPPFIFRGLLWAVLMEVPAAVKGLVQGFLGFIARISFVGGFYILAKGVM